jgi:ribose transport system substrate-binding protein
MVKKSVLWIVILGLVITMGAGFTLTGCKTTTAETTAIETTAAETTVAETTVAETTATETTKPLTIGHISMNNIGWYNYLNSAVDMMAKKYNVTISRVLTEYTVEKEIQGVEDLITAGVDGIILGSTSADSCQRAAQLCNEANIPLVIENSSIAEGPGTIVADMEFDWSLLGKMMAEKTIENWPGSKVVVVTGVIGTGPIDMLLKAFKDTVQSSGKIELINVLPGEYTEEKALTETENLIQSGTEFDVIWGNTGEMTEGIIEALKSADLLGKKIVLSTNGGPLDMDNLKDGDENACINYSPGFHGLITFLAMYNHLVGKEVPKLTYLPMKWITLDTINEAFPWQMDETFIPVAEKFMETGKLE